jgi:hypothetical protein
MLKKITAATIAVLTLFHTSVASARQWVILSNNPVVSIDVDSIKGEGNTRTFWSELVYNQERSSSSSYVGFERDRYKSIKTLTFVDCAKNKLGVLRRVGYASDGAVVDDYDNSHFSVPPNLESTIPDSIGEAELLYVCGLRTSNGGISYNTPSSSSKPKPTSATASRNRSFPRATCGDPFQSSGTYWPVFIDGGSVSKIRTNLCKDAFTTVRANTGVKSVQLGSFTSYDRASAFAKQVGGTVGQATRYVNGRTID